MISHSLYDLPAPLVLSLLGEVGISGRGELSYDNYVTKH